MKSVSISIISKMEKKCNHFFNIMRKMVKSYLFCDKYNKLSLNTNRKDNKKTAVI